VLEDVILLALAANKRGCLGAVSLRARLQVGAR
jgi:hypothetical protein